MTVTLDQLNLAHDLMSKCAEEIYFKTGLKIRLSMSQAPLLSIEPHEILPVIAHALGRKMSDYTARNRKPDIVALRFLAALFINQYWPTFQKYKIGNLFEQDHSTTLRGLKTSQILLETGDQHFTSRYMTVKEAVEKWLMNYEKADN